MSSAVTKYKQSYKIDIGVEDNDQEEEIVEMPLLPQERSYGIIKKWMDLLGKLTFTPLTEEEAAKRIVTAIRSYLNRKKAMFKRKHNDKGDEIIR